jgi:hypothetical protein
VIVSKMLNGKLVTSDGENALLENLSSNRNFKK